MDHRNRQRVAPHRRTFNRGARGFTLAELLVVISVLGVLSGVVVFAVGGINDRGQVAACDEDARTLKTAVESFRAKTGGLPADQNAIVNAGFLSQPSTLTSYTLTGTTYAVAPLGVCATAAGVGTTIAAQPTTTTGARNTMSGGSDMFVNATIVPPLSAAAITTVNVDGTGYTAEAGEPWIGAGSYASAWFAYTPTVTQSIRLQGAGYNKPGGSIWLGLYSGSTINALTTLAQWNGRTAVFSAVAGQTYRIQVFTNLGQGTTGTMQFFEGIAESPDAFAGATAVASLASGSSQTIAIDGAGATTEQGEPWIGGSGYASVWLAYTPSVDQSIKITTAGYSAPGMNNWIGVYKGSTLASLVMVQQVGNRYVGFTAIAGQAYRIQVFSQYGSATTGSVLIQEGASAGLDLFAGAAPVAVIAPGGNATIAIDLSQATTETIEPWIGGGGYSSVWLSYTPSSNQPIGIAVTGATNNNVWIGVYQGTTINALTTVIQTSARATSVFLVAGQPYRFQIFTQYGSGSVGSVSFVDGSNTADIFANAITVAPVAPGSNSVTNFDASNTTTEPTEPWVGGQGAYGTVWLAYSPTQNETLQVDTTGFTNTSTWIGIYRGNTLASLVSLVQNGSRTASIGVTAGQPYRIQIFTTVPNGTTGSAKFTAT